MRGREVREWRKEKGRQEGGCRGKALSFWPEELSRMCGALKGQHAPCIRTYCQGFYVAFSSLPPPSPPQLSTRTH